MLDSSKNYDVYTFFENEEDESETQVKFVDLEEDSIGEYITEGDSVMGHVYQIILCKDHKTDPDKYDHLDYFEAILSHPLTYIKQMIEWGWYGVIIRKTTKSQDIVDMTLDNLKKAL